MLSRDEAFASALEYLTQAYAGQYTIVLQPEKSTEYPAAWAVRFDSQEYLDTGDLGRSPFVRVVVVPKDGSGPRFPPSHQTVEEFVAELSGTTPPTGA
ncbi:hypothetical protein GCM10010420_21180 [Streptomyces glaucosporus]|uniref:Immunity protein 35 domain-containing protein n=1 Tax=Streptomyces glaucosporus TaxID=284044 RepID=A0ABN3I6Y0_9ACTN